MKKFLPVIVFVIFAAGAAYFLVFAGSKTNDTTSTKDNSEVTETENSSQNSNDSGGNQEYTNAQVAEHSTANDCWTIINDKVYDLTSYVPRHPGGDEILRACGTDGTTLFEDRTTSDGQVVGGGGSHSSSAEAALESLRIGSIQN